MLSQQRFYGRIVPVEVAFSLAEKGLSLYTTFPSVASRCTWKPRERKDTGKREIFELGLAFHSIDGNYKRMILHTNQAWRIP